MGKAFTVSRGKFRIDDNGNIARINDEETSDHIGDLMMVTDGGVIGFQEVRYVAADATNDTESLVEISDLACEVAAGTCWEFTVTLMVANEDAGEGVEVAMDGYAPGSGTISYLTTSSECSAYCDDFEQATDGSVIDDAGHFYTVTIRGIFDNTTAVTDDLVPSFKSTKAGSTATIRKGSVAHYRKVVTWP
jgi:hypothetical protein